MKKSKKKASFSRANKPSELILGPLFLLLLAVFPSKAEDLFLKKAAPSSPQTDEISSLLLENKESLEIPPTKNSSSAKRSIPGTVTVLHGLDKTSARVFSIEAKHDQPVTFGTLKIRVRGCRRTLPEDEPESAAFLEISEKKKNQEPQSLFSGWMFASHPSVSCLDHPVYDVWVTECRNPST